MDRLQEDGMTEIVLYHHVQGLTEGVRSVANRLPRAGHTVHTPLALLDTVQAEAR
jgi:dienelactone hydrolase